jgi:hypothetical protein
MVRAFVSAHCAHVSLRDHESTVGCCPCHGQRLRQNEELRDEVHRNEDSFECSVVEDAGQLKHPLALALENVDHCPLFRLSNHIKLWLTQ